jgi:two-component system response regulator HydG
MFERILLAGSTFPDALRAQLESCTDKLSFVPTLEAATKLLRDKETYDLVFADCQVALPVVQELIEAATCSANLVIGLIDAADTQRRAKLEETTSILDIQPLPCTPDAISRTLRSAYKHIKLLGEIQHYRATHAPPVELIGRCDSMRQIISSLSQYAGARKPILVSGPPGSGKDALAHALHRQSPHAHGPLITVECADVPDKLLEARLFGGKSAGTTIHLRRQRLPFLPLAGGGTLLLNNIDALPPSLLEKLLPHARENTEAALPRPAVQIIGMSRKEPAELERGSPFGPALSQKFQVIELPPLREREDDGLLLADYQLRVLSADLKRDVTLDVSAREAILKHNWPGNVKELHCAIQRALQVCRGDKLDAAALALAGGAPAQANPGTTAGSNVLRDAPASGTSTLLGTPNADVLSFKVGHKLADMERQMMLRTVEMTGGNRTQAAAMLGISVRTLYTKLLDQGQPAESAKPEMAQPQE